MKRKKKKRGKRRGRKRRERKRREREMNRRECIMRQEAASVSQTSVVAFIDAHSEILACSSFRTITTPNITLRLPIRLAST